MRTQIIASCWRASDYISDFVLVFFIALSRIEACRELEGKEKERTVPLKRLNGNYECSTDRLHE